jgi:hypothetical protein
MAMVVVAVVAAFLLSLTATVAPPTVGAVAVAAGFKDHVYGPNPIEPTEDKPQSKVWFTDGSWWAGMYVDGAVDAYQIHRYNASTHVWTSTNVTVDVRDSSHGDYLWDAATNSLFVASVGTNSDPDPILVFKLNYNPGTDTYTHDPAFTASGVTAGVGPTETATIAKDSTGQLWITYQNPVDPTGATTDNRKVMINRSTAAGQHDWGTAFSIGEMSDDDISANIAFGGNAVGVMWSDQNPSAMQTFFYFSSHADGNADDTAWSTKQTSASGPDEFAEDHVNLKLAATGSGQVLAAVKTNGGPEHIRLLSRNASTGAWTQQVVVSGGLDVTRPQVVVDETNGVAYVLYTSPELAGDGNQAIYYKSAPLSTLDFNEAGLGTAFIQDGTNDISDISTAKHNVTAATGLLGIAASETNTTYYHGFLPLGTAPGHPFTDIDGHQFEQEITWLYQEGITTGCTPTTFCPDSSVTREQMASFLVRAFDLAPSSVDRFTDDNGTFHENDINALAAAGITTGCTPTTYCPKGVVSRQEMASFLVRALPDVGPSSDDQFVDDDGSPHEPDINGLALSGITNGCNPAAGLFCPLNPVTRGQMAAFLFRGLS